MPLYSCTENVRFLNEVVSSSASVLKHLQLILQRVHAIPIIIISNTTLFLTPISSSNIQGRVWVTEVYALSRLNSCTCSITDLDHVLSVYLISGT
jgi:hypothetical protein